MSEAGFYYNIDMMVMKNQSVGSMGKLVFEVLVSFFSLLLNAELWKQL
jgi:hypothetical protein